MNDQIYMAPLLAFTNCTYREIFFKHFSGIDRAISPFIVVSENGRYKRSAVESLLPNLHETIPVEPQILAKDPLAFAALVSLLEDVGFKSVNFNLGCPARAVVNKGRGSGLLPYPEKIRDFLDKSMERINIPISIKLRTGLNSHDEIYPIIDVLNDYPISEVIIHPRLGVHKYEGYANHEIMDKIVHLFKAPLVYNGDVSRKSFEILQDRFPEVSRWMVGRELLKDPYLAEDIKTTLGDESKPLSEISPMDIKRRTTIMDFHDDLLKSFSRIIKREEALVGKMKSYWFYMESLFSGKENEIDLRDFISDGSILKKIRKELDKDNLSVWERTGLMGWKQFFECNAIENSEALEIQKKLIAMEGELGRKRRSYPLGYTDPETGKFIEAGMGKLLLVIGNDPHEETRKAAWQGIRDLETFVLENGYIELAVCRVDKPS